MPTDADRLVAASLVDALREMGMAEVSVKPHDGHGWEVEYLEPSGCVVSFIGPDLDALAEAIMECLGGAEA
jgi:hypothetical protein